MTRSTGSPSEAVLEGRALLVTIPTSTSTQGNSDAPREAPPADLVRFYDGYDRITPEQRAFGAVEVTGDPEPAQPHKTSSPELASLAAKYVGMDDETMSERAVWAEIRRLAASVLSQAEGGTK